MPASGIDTLKMCGRKKAFASREAAAVTGMHVYRWSGQVSRIANPVLPRSFTFSHDDERERRCG
jgi:hypothetical protein